MHKLEDKKRLYRKYFQDAALADSLGHDRMSGISQHDQYSYNMDSWTKAICIIIE